MCQLRKSLDPVNITHFYVLNNDTEEDLLRFRPTIHLRRKITTTNTLADVGATDNLIAPSFLGSLERSGSSNWGGGEGMDGSVHRSQAAAIGNDETRQSTSGF